MNIRTVITLAIAAALLTACLPSVNPYYRDQDIVFDPALLGEWVEGGETWAFERHDGDDAYSLTYSSGGERGEMIATLFTLGEHRFLDVIAAEYDFPDDQWEIVSASLFSGHLLFHIEAIEPNLSMSLLDYDWLEEYIDENPRALKHNIVGGERILLTGETRELQRFLLKNIGDGELFSDYGELTRPDSGVY